jgi:ABC-type Fe3+ transport system permease subunit
VKRNKLAITSLVLAILGFNIIAAILGHIALGQIKKSNQGGKGIATAAVVIGWIGTVVLALALLFPYEFFYTLGYAYGSIKKVLGIN